MAFMFTQRQRSYALLHQDHRRARRAGRVRNRINFAVRWTSWKTRKQLYQARPWTIYVTLTLCAFVLWALSCATVRHKTLEALNRVKSRPWTKFPRVNGYYQGLEGLIPSPKAAHTDKSSTTYPSPFKYNPYPEYTSEEYQSTGAKVESCTLEEEDDRPLPSVWAYAGTIRSAPEPLFGSYELLGLRGDVCFDRYGRYGAYGLGYEKGRGGTGLGLHGDRRGLETIQNAEFRRDWRGIDIGLAQRRCNERNRHRFAGHSASGSGAGTPAVSRRAPRLENRPRANKHLPKTAVVLRIWQGFEYTEYAKLYIRSLVSELNLGSGSEYDIHLLVEVKDLSNPIWTSQQRYDELLNDTVPAEFRSMATLWSEKLMETVYPGPFEPQFAYHGPIHWVVRSMQFALQWFAMQHTEYDYFWNWEMDLRYVGHWYELFDRASKWAREQPTDGLWTRNGRFYIPGLYGNWSDFTRLTGELSNGHGVKSTVSDLRPDNEEHAKPWNSWGPSVSDKGVGEEADFITLQPMFDPDGTNWVYRNDVSGYDTSQPIPPRRVSIVTASRLSRRLVEIMHEESYNSHHSMASEMFPASMALHHDLKAVFAPHPVYFDRDWPPEYADAVFNGGPGGASGGYWGSVFSEWPQHNFQGSTYYYNSGFAGALWRRWLRHRENGEGGEVEEVSEKGGGRMCLRSVLLHPIKWEDGPPR